MGKRLANQKTRLETGFDHVINSINVQTPFGKKRLKEIKPYFPGSESQLISELDKASEMLSVVKEYQSVIDRLNEIFMEVKDNSFTIERSRSSVLTVVELFEIKSFLLQTMRIRELFSKEGKGLPSEYMPLDTEALLNILDPGKDRINTFYIYDSFSAKLGEFRQEKRQLELSLRKERKAMKKHIEEKYGISLSPKFEFPVTKTYTELMKTVSAIPELVLLEEDYMTATFTLRPTDEADELQRHMEAVNDRIDEEELIVCQRLSEEIGSFSEVLLKNCRIIGALDLALAKARYAKDHNCVKPVIVSGHKIAIEEGRNLLVEEALHSKGKEYCPVSIYLKDGVTCITGANMGGKTVSLKLVGQVALLAQYGFFVPCEEAEIGLSGYIHMLIGDSQNIQRGLSSFGSEMEELKDILDNSRDRSLLLIDEIANGTNPVEGLALTKSLVSYLVQKPYITLITTHFDNVSDGNEVTNMQVMGLAGADMDKLMKEIRYANRSERIDIIGKYMDYRLHEVHTGREIPKDALTIAAMLGIDSDIIEKARSYIDKK